MTERVFLTDSHRVVCDAVVTACTQTKDGYDIELDRTVFFPNAGGQPCDTGVLEADGAIIAVSGCDERGDVLVHHAGGSIPVGTRVTARIDWARRFDLMQQHTGEHLLSYAAHALFGAANIGFHLNTSFGTIDLDRPLTAEQVTELERHTNALLQRNLPVTAVLYESEADIAGLPLRKHAEGLTAPIRIVTIRDADCCTCCAPHCGATGEVGVLLVTDAAPYKGGMRLTFLAGMRAVAHARTVHNTADTLARRFSTGRENVVSLVQKQYEELGAAKKQEKALSAQLSAYIAERLCRGAKTAGKAQLVAAIPDGLGGSMLRPLAQQVLSGFGADARALVFLLAETGERLQYILLASDALKLDMGEVCQAVNTALGGKGGGRGTLAQGSAPAQPGLPETFAQLENYLLQRLKAIR